jgi:hypothetical protein
MGDAAFAMASKQANTLLWQTAVAAALLMDSPLYGYGEDAVGETMLRGDGRRKRGASERKRDTGQQGGLHSSPLGGFPRSEALL